MNNKICPQLTGQRGKSALIITVLIFSLSGCATFNPGLIRYNQDKGLYEYGEGGILLRNSDNELISESNYESFMQELEMNDNEYQNSKIIENANSIKAIDHKIASLYSESVNAINNGEYEEAREKTDKLLSLYPDALFFSDCSFLDAAAFQNSENTLAAKEKYQEFLIYSAGKYSERFRGHRNSDTNDSLWIQQRNYAKDFIAGEPVKANDKFLKPLTPKHYYSSFHPGYGINPEDYAENTKDIIMFVFGMDMADKIAFGVQYYRQLNKFLDINPRYLTSGAINEAGLALPIKLFKSEDNSFALKISPFLSYSRIKELSIDGTTLETDDNMFDFGLKASAGYYFAPKISLGASYIYHRYNESDKFPIKNQNVEIWYFNEYDISLYYDLFKGFSLKSGIKAGDFVAGIYWSGWEISYNFNQNGFVFRTDMF
jgi:hypothetical protein